MNSGHRDCCVCGLDFAAEPIRITEVYGLFIVH